MEVLMFFNKLFFNKINFCCLLGLLCYLVPVRAQFNYPNFSNTDSLILRGNAAVIDDKLRLTTNTKMQKSAVWYKVPQPINTFSTTWQFRITNPGGLSPGGADGIVLVIQTYDDSALGNNGGSLAYDFPKSLAVEIDTWDNSEFNDPIRPHISVQTKGILANNPSHNFSLGCKTGLTNLSDGLIHTVRVTYSRPNLNVYLDDVFLPKLSVTVNLADTIDAIDNLAWVGLTSATGNAYENHFILNWSFDSVITKPSPIIFLPGIMGSPLYDVSSLIWVDFFDLVRPDDYFMDALELKTNGQDPANSSYQIRTTPWLNGPTPKDVSSYLSYPFYPYYPLYKYRTLIDYLEERGYKLDDWDTSHTEGENFYVFTYDWRKSIENLADSLKFIIDSLKKWTGANKIKIVAHSMGGLVTKDYLAKYGSNSIEKIIFLGTPHLGAAEMSYTMLTGNVVNWINLAPNSLMFKKLARNFPSCYQLIPNEHYFDISIGNGFSNNVELYTGYLSKKRFALDFPSTIKYFKNASWDGRLEFNSNLLDYSLEIQEDLWNINWDSINCFNIVGCNIPTIGHIIANPLYHHFDELTTLNGDGTVPLRSAEIVNYHKRRADFYISGVDHIGLCNDQQTLELLANLLPDYPDTSLTGFDHISRQPPSDYSVSGIYVTILGGIKINIFDELGMRIGPVNDTLWEINIDNSGLLGGMMFNPEGPKIIYLPLNKQYRTIIESPDSGQSGLLNFTKIINGVVQARACFDSIFLPANAVGRSNFTPINYNLELNIDLNNDSVAEYKLWPDWLMSIIALKEGWNLISLPIEISEKGITDIFPRATSQAFTYNGSYQTQDTLPENHGFWLKSAATETINIFGKTKYQDTISVRQGWNIINSLSGYIPTTTVISIPENIIISNFYGYDETYFTADTLLPGKGYWVKVNADGELIISNLNN